MFGKNQHQPFLGRDLFEQKDYSEETSRNIDLEVKNLVESAHGRARKLLTENRDKLDLISQNLIEKEVIDIFEARKLLGMPAEPEEIAVEEPSNEIQDQNNPDDSNNDKTV